MSNNGAAPSQTENRSVCFVIMPISDPHGYEPGHFGRVYEHVLKPAIIEAGYVPVRADDTNKTDYIVVSIIQKIVDSAMVLCDYSARNPNVMYELGIRHSFNLPVVLVKDRKTDKVFDIQGLRFSEYDETLRVDSVQKDIGRISSAIKETAAADSGSYNSVVQLAGIRPATPPVQQQITPETQLLLSAIAALERRIDDGERQSAVVQDYFRFVDDKVEFSDSTTAELNDTVYGANAKPIGSLIDIQPPVGKIFLRQDDGKVIPYSSKSVKSKGLTTIPF